MWVLTVIAVALMVIAGTIRMVKNSDWQTVAMRKAQRKDAELRALGAEYDSSEIEDDIDDQMTNPAYRFLLSNIYHSDDE
jgi:hypothetical protein